MRHKGISFKYIYITIQSRYFSIYLRPQVILFTIYERTFLFYYLKQIITPMFPFDNTIKDTVCNTIYYDSDLQIDMILP